MKKFWSIVQCAVLLLASTYSAQAQYTTASQAKTQQWEYKVVHLGSIEGTNQMYGSHEVGPYQSGLNKFGAEGWQLTVIDTFQGVKVAIFRRPLQ